MARADGDQDLVFADFARRDYVGVWDRQRDDGRLPSSWLFANWLKGDVLGLVAGTRLTSGATNFMRLHTVGESENPSAKRRGKKKQE